MNGNISVVTFQNPIRLGEPSEVTLRYFSTPCQEQYKHERRTTVDLTHADYTPAQLRTIAAHLALAAKIADGEA